VAKGYNSENEVMDLWLKNNPEKYCHLEIGGIYFIVECFTERFKDGDKSDSIVEIWIPVYKKR